MRDQTVRKAFHQTVLKSAHNDADTFVLDEFGLRNGVNRADIAVLNGKFVGYEIKTEKDTLARLGPQIEAYNEVFDQVFIITASNHLSKVIERIPDWWGVYLIEQNDVSDISFSLHRKAKINKAKNTYGIAQLLWKAELMEILAKLFRTEMNTRVTKHQMYELLSQKCTSHKFGSIALTYLKNRQGWRIGQKLSL
jgi:hypothetical protein